MSGTLKKEVVRIIVRPWFPVSSTVEKNCTIYTVEIYDYGSRSFTALAALRRFSSLMAA